MLYYESTMSVTYGEGEDKEYVVNTQTIEQGQNFGLYT